MTKEITMTEDYHKQCHHCERLLHPSRWVKKDHPTKKYALCCECAIMAQEIQTKKHSPLPGVEDA